MFRVNTEKRFLRRPDGSWHVPVICEGREGAKADAAVRIVTSSNPSEEAFWQSAHRLCRDLRSHGYRLGREGEEWIVVRPALDPLEL